MLPFESPSSLVLMVATAIIIISYAILLIKLKPSIKIGKRPTSLNRTQKSVSRQKTPEKSAKKSESIEKDLTKTVAETAVTEEIQKAKEDEKAKKSFLLFGERSFEGCPHKFGHLSSLPKNTPIPDECFGCPQVVECLRT